MPKEEKLRPSELSPKDRQDEFNQEFEQFGTHLGELNKIIMKWNTETQGFFNPYLEDQLIKIADNLSSISKIYCMHKLFGPEKPFGYLLLEEQRDYNTEQTQKEKIKDLIQTR